MKELIAKQAALQEFIRDMKKMSIDIEGYAEKNYQLSTAYHARAQYPKEGDINTPSENMANSHIYHGKAEAFAYIKKEIDNLIKFYGL